MRAEELPTAACAQRTVPVRRRDRSRASIASGVFLISQLGMGLAPAWAGTIAVTDCGNGEATPGTLRNAIRVQAASGDIVDLAGAPCSAIPVAGAIVIPATLETLTVRGPADREFVLNGGGANTLMVKLGAATTLRIERLTIANGFWASTDNGGGGCLFAQGNLALVHSTVRDCRTGSDINSASGAGVRVSGNLELTDSTLRGNLVRGISARGGAAQVGGNATLVRSRIVANTAQVSATAATTSANGGGLHVAGNLLVDDSTIAGNTVTTAGASGPDATAGGGGVWVSGGRLTITGSAITGNRSSGQGGGLVVNNFDSFPGQVQANLVNSTISGNVAASGLGGGMLSFSVPLRLRNSTLVFNASGEGAGGLLVLGTGIALELQSTLAANNGVGGDIGAQNVIVASGANNLVRNTFQITMPAGTLTADPQIGALYAHGGLTRTHAPTVGSPIIDNGNNVAGLAFDQRGAGFPRAAGPVDIGAFERQSPGDGLDGLYQDGFGD